MTTNTMNLNEPFFPLPKIAKCGEDCASQLVPLSMNHEKKMKILMNTMKLEAFARKIVSK